jgi:hypothetical protein
VVPDLGDPPLFGLIALALYRSDREELRAQCPGCGRIVKIHDALCTRCGTELEFRTRSSRLKQQSAADRLARMMRAVDAVMECLRAEGVDVVFGYPGGANLPDVRRLRGVGHPSRTRTA